MIIDGGDYHDSAYKLSERIYHFREAIDVQRRFDFDQLIIDIRQGAALEPHLHLPIFKTNKMRSIEELKNEIHELNNVLTGVISEIGVLNAQNRNAQNKRDKIIAKIDGLEWMLDEGDEQRSAGK